MDSRVDAAELKVFMANLAALHHWEMENLPFVHTTTGRQLYYMVAQRAVAEPAQLQRSLKDLFTSPHFTEKAMRIRMQDMEGQGFFTLISAPGDGRNKQLVPAQKFHETLHAHVREARRLFHDSFLLIPR